MGDHAIAILFDRQVPQKAGLKQAHNVKEFCDRLAWHELVSYKSRMHNFLWILVERINF